MCSNGTRVYVHEKIVDKFLQRLVEKTKNMKIGNPFDEDTVVGATISREQAEKVFSYIDIAQKEVCISHFQSGYLTSLFLLVQYFLVTSLVTRHF